MKIIIKLVIFDQKYSIMKTKLFISIAFLLFANFLPAQKPIKVEETKYGFSSGKQNALMVTIYEVPQKTVEKEWTKKMKKYKAKVSNKGGEIFADNALIKDISDNTIDIYAVAKETKDNEIEFYVGFNLGGAYLNSSDHPDKYKVAKNMLIRFSKDMSKEMLEDKIKDQEKILNKKINEKEKLEKENKKLAKDIENYKEKIKDAEKDIENNKKEKAEKLKEIEAQKKIVDELRDKLKKID